MTLIQEETLEDKRKVEYEFFLSILKDFGEQGLRPHQAIAVLTNLIERSRGISGEDKFYWEGVFGPKFTNEKPDNLPKGYTWSTLNGKK